MFNKLIPTKLTRDSYCYNVAPDSTEYAERLLGTFGGRDAVGECTRRRTKLSKTMDGLFEDYEMVDGVHDPKGWKMLVDAASNDPATKPINGLTYLQDTPSVASPIGIEGVATLSAVVVPISLSAESRSREVERLYGLPSNTTNVPKHTCSIVAGIFSNEKARQVAPEGCKIFLTEQHGKLVYDRKAFIAHLETLDKSKTLTILQLIFFYSYAEKSELPKIHEVLVKNGYAPCEGIFDADGSIIASRFYPV